MNQPTEHSANASLATLVILQLVMLAALFALTVPHPPAAIPLFGIGPFIGASLSAAVSAVIIGPLTSKTGRVLCVLAALLALISFGPQKYFDPQFGLIWPAVIAAQIAVITLFYSVFRSIKWRAQ
jgi:hypothetical protein